MRKLSAVAVLLLILLLVGSAPAAANDIQVLINGQPLATDVAPLIENGRTLVPVRAITERLGASVDWKETTRQVEIKLDGRTLVLFIDNTKAQVDGQTVELDVPARIVSGRTLVPARFISENLSAKVDWDANTRTVTITTYQNVGATLAETEQAVLAALNEARANLALTPLTLVDELSQMARSHAGEMASSGYFAHISPSYGDTAARATARGLRVNLEYLAYGLPDAAAIARSLLDGAQGSALLAEEGGFIGIGLAQGGSSSAADLYAVAELVTGDGLILGAQQRTVSGNTLELTGYAQNGATVTVYLLDGQDNYLSRRSETVGVSGNAGAFSMTVTLWQQGCYAVVLGSEKIIVENN